MLLDYCLYNYCTYMLIYIYIHIYYSFQSLAAQTFQSVNINYHKLPLLSLPTISHARELLKLHSKYRNSFRQFSRQVQCHLQPTRSKQVSFSRCEIFTLTKLKFVVDCCSKLIRIFIGIG